MKMNDGKMKYAALTTVETSMRSFCLPLVAELSKQGAEVAMLCNMSDAFLEQYAQQYKCIPMGIRRGFHAGNLLKTIWQLRAIFKREKFDMIQYGTENMAFCASIAAWMAGVPVRIYEHWGARYVGYSGVMRFVSKMIERTAALFSTDVRQVSHRNMEMCVADRIYSKKKVKVLGKGGTVGVDFTRFDLNQKAEHCAQVRQQLGIPQDATLFGFVGRIQSDKGINELLDAFRGLCEKREDVYLLLVGAVDEANPVDAEKMQWAQECPRVIFPGFVSDVQRYMSAFDVLVHPTYREGFGMVLQEAAALGIAIITTDIMGPGEYILNGQTGVLVEAKNSHALQQAMEALGTDPQERARLAENNYEYTYAFFERSVMVGRILEDRAELLKNRGLPKQ